jgi:hypothetical protein
MVTDTELVAETVVHAVTGWRRHISTVKHIMNHEKRYYFLGQ